MAAAARRGATDRSRSELPDSLRFLSATAARPGATVAPIAGLLVRFERSSRLRLHAGTKVATQN